jgi:hypothetical protein
MFKCLNGNEIVIFTVTGNDRNMTSFADRVIEFLSGLQFAGELPAGVSVMNPYTGDRKVMDVVSQFYRKFYSDNNQRHMIMGINPGRFGAGTTGIPFTDTVRLKEKCGLEIDGYKTYEPSSVFIYDMIDSYGGTGRFYGDFFFSSVSPLGFTQNGPKGHDVNYNYYDSREMTSAILDFAIESIEEQLEFGITRDVCYCLGSGKNFNFLLKLNDSHHFFEKIEPLDHPRFIMQYRSKQKQAYIDTYLKKLGMTNSLK